MWDPRRVSKWAGKKDRAFGSRWIELEGERERPLRQVLTSPKDIDVGVGVGQGRGVEGCGCPASKPPVGFGWRAETVPPWTVHKPLPFITESNGRAATAGDQDVNANTKCWFWENNSPILWANPACSPLSYNRSWNAALHAAVMTDEKEEEKAEGKRLQGAKRSFARASARITSRLWNRVETRFWVYGKQPLGRLILETPRWLSTPALWSTCHC